jgi:predicted RNA binding protein YcfA (HicA-like mRNA interferase family)
MFILANNRFCFNRLLSFILFVLNMEKNEKLVLKILSGRSDNNIKFSDLINLIISFGFDIRISGSHHLFRKEGIKDRINLQKDGDKAKQYQVRQIRNLILKYKLGDFYEK